MPSSSYHTTKFDVSPFHIAYLKQQRKRDHYHAISFVIFTILTVRLIDELAFLFF